MSEVKQLSDRELDALVADASGLPIHYYLPEGWHPHQGDHEWLADPANYPHLTAKPDRSRFLYWATPNTNGVEWQPSEDIACAFQVEDRIAALGLQSNYVDAVMHCVSVGMHSNPASMYFAMLHLSARERCIAAFAALSTTPEETKRAL